MPRPKLGQLYKVKNSDNWFFQKKGFVGRIDTGTQDRFRAEQFLRAATVKVGDPTPSPEEQQIADGLQTLAASLDPRFQPEKPPVVKDETQENDDLNVGERDTRSNPLPFKTNPLPMPTSGVKSTVSADKAGLALDQFKSRFTPQKRERLFGALGSGLSRVNAVGLELALGLGNLRLKESYVFTPDDLEIIKTAYELGLEELFNTSDPEWYHLLLVGNISLVVGMLPAIEKKPPKPPKGFVPKVVPNGK